MTMKTGICGTRPLEDRESDVSNLRFFIRLKQRKRERELKAK